MKNNKKILAIIPARGGSKGIPRKNIKSLNGKPLLYYTIEETLKSKYIDKLIVSTEDKEIADLSRAYGDNIPLMRPKELAMDNTPGIDPILYSVKWYKDQDDNYDYVICLQCTSPFRQVHQIDEAIEKLINEDGDSIVSVCESEVNPFWMKTVEEGFMKDFLKDAPFYARRQDTPVIYRLNGAIYIAKTEVLMKNKNWYTDKTLAYVMDRKTSIDIDDLTDFEFAEFLMKEKNNDK